MLLLQYVPIPASCSRLLVPSLCCTLFSRFIPTGSDLLSSSGWYMDTIIVDQGRSSMYGFVEPQTIQPSGNTLQNRQHYLQTWMDESKRDVYLVPYIDGKMKNDLRTMLQGASREHLLYQRTQLGR
ncbi:hypothetical protein LR48_Vigan03g124600 [Vigna angularis]|uniref:Uncharacterized protein n=1 Tax=Phaseolus angularis TaxID=3914 RepID=A0A0L9U619_PHAAN|nr:hypothetical protein LR48_Vigan03g124600 [Vigna angularis]